MRQLPDRLNATRAKLIWATTTPVPDKTANCREGDELSYNAAAQQIMAEKGIPVDDLHALAASRLAELQWSANVHLTDEGSRVLGEQVAKHIENALGK